MQERKDFLTVIFLIDHLEVEIFILIMEHQLQELKVDGRPCFEKVSLMTDEATIHVTCSEYFFCVVRNWKLFFIIIRKIMWRNCNMRSREMGV